MISTRSNSLVVFLALLAFTARTPADAQVSNATEWAAGDDMHFWTSAWLEAFSPGEEAEPSDLIGIIPAKESYFAGQTGQIRDELHGQAEDYVGMLQSAGLLMTDPFLDDFVYRVLLEVAPSSMPPTHPGAFRVYINRDPAANASALVHGAVILNSGLLARLESRAELVAVLAHEVAHIVLDHSLQAETENQATQDELERRARRQARIGGILTGLAGALATRASGGSWEDAAAIGTAAGVGVGAATHAAALGSAREAAVLAGARFSQNQEAEADLVALAWLRENGYSEVALASALERISDYRAAPYSAYEAALNASHPPISHRIAGILGGKTSVGQGQWQKQPGGGRSRIGVVFQEPTPEGLLRLAEFQSQRDRSFDSEVQEVLLDAARGAADLYQDYGAAWSILERAVSSGSPSAEALILASRIWRHQADDAEAVSRAASYVALADSISEAPNWQLYLETALVRKRQGQYSAAQDELRRIFTIDERGRPVSDRWVASAIEKLRR